MHTIHQISDSLDAAALAMKLQDLDRARTIVVAAAAPGGQTPAVDMRTLAAGMDDDCELVTIAPPWTRDLTKCMGDAGSVTDGAVRIYPPGRDAAHSLLWHPIGTAKDFAHRILSDLHPAQQAGSTAIGPADTSVPSSEAAPFARRSDGAIEARTTDEGLALAELLLHPHRERPLVLVSVALGRQQPYADIPEIISTVGDWCTVAIIHTGPATRAFSSRLPRGTEAFGGAGRVYPLGRQWLDDWDAAPLHFATDPRDAGHLTRSLLRDAWALAPHKTTSTTPAPDQVTARGVVIGFAAGRAMVSLDNGHMATIWPEAINPALEPKQLLRPGMRVHGLHHTIAGHLDITPMRQTPAQALADYQVGNQVLVQVTGITDDHLTVALLPDTPGRIERHEVTTSTLRLDELISPDEILVARILTTTPWTLSLDVDDTAPLHPAPAILTDGPPWLTTPQPEPPNQPATPSDDPTQPAASAIPAESPIADESAPATAAVELTGPEVDWEAERQQSAAQLRRERATSKRLKNELADARTKLREATRRSNQLATDLAALQQATGRASDDEHLFSDPVDQFRFEVHLAWARRIPAAQKATLMLQDYEVGPYFLETLTQVQGIDRAKIIDVVVEILTGLDATLDSRDLHRLRTSNAGNAPPRTRDDGSTAWRVSLQQATPSARRLHYWRRPDGTIELSSIRTHDDMRP